MPSASTELFLRLEAAAAYEPEEAVAGMSDSSQPCVMSVCAHAAKEQYIAPFMQCIPPLLQSQATVSHIPHLQQQQLPEQEEDVYAGLERGTDASSALFPSWHAAIATAKLPQTQGAPGHALNQDLVGFGVVPGPGQSKTAPEQGFPGRGPEHGHKGHAHSMCKEEPRGNLTPKAAEAPLVKQGSYAVAAKVARLRSKRRQKEIEQLHASQRHVHTTAGGKPAVQVIQTLPS